MKRVLHLCAGNLYGGVETILSRFARYQHHANLEHHFALCFEGRLSNELKALGTVPHRLGQVRISHPWTVTAARCMLANLLVREKFDVVATHLAWPHAIFAKVARRSGLPVIFYAHNPLIAPTWLDRWAARTIPDHLIGCSRHTTRSYAPMFPTVSSTTVYCPVIADTDLHSRERPSAIRQSLNTSSDDLVIIQISRIERWKGHDQLLSALATIKTKQSWKCWIVGGVQRPAEQKYLGELVAQRDRLHLTDRVQFLGERNDVPSLLAAADIFCQANRAPEGFGIVFMEAFAANLPVITMRLGPAEEIVAPGCGVLIEPENISALANAIDELIESPARRQQLGNAGHQHVKKLSDPDTQLQELARAIEMTLEKRPRR